MNAPNMPILNKISAMLKKSGKTQKELCEHLGLKQQAFTNWKNGNNDSYMKYLPQIAEYFNVSVDYLLGNPSKSIENGFIPADLVELLEALTEDEWKELGNYAHYLIHRRGKK